MAGPEALARREAKPGRRIRRAAVCPSRPTGTVTANGITFSCSSGGSSTSPQYQWLPAGTAAGDDTSGIALISTGSEGSANFSPGAVLDGGGDAIVLGSYWDDVGSMSDFKSGLTACVDTSCDPVGGLQE